MWHRPKRSYGLQSPSSSENATSRSGDGNGRLGSDGMSYNAIRSSVRSHTHKALPGGHAPRQVLADRFADAMRQVERSAVGLTPKEAQLIRDFRKGRYIGGVLQALEISRRCVDPSDATALPDTMRGFIIAEHPRFSVSCVEADRLETGANGEFDLAVLEWRLHPSRANKERAIEAGRRQEMATRQMIDALERSR